MRCTLRYTSPALHKGNRLAAAHWAIASTSAARVSLIGVVKASSAAPTSASLIPLHLEEHTAQPLEAREGCCVQVVTLMRDKPPPRHWRVTMMQHSGELLTGFPALLRHALA